MLAMLTSFSVAAENNQRQADAWYVGADVVSSEATQGTDNNDDEKYDLDVLGGFHAGYEKNIVSGFSAAIELEFINYGSYTLEKVNARTNSGHNIVADKDITFTSLNLNIRPKYYIAETGVYVGGLVGFGRMTVEYELTKSGYESLTLDDETGTALNYGLEVGYEFKNGWIVSAGMRNAKAEIKHKDVDIKATYAGARYKF